MSARSQRQNRSSSKRSLNVWSDSDSLNEYNANMVSSDEETDEDYSTSKVSNAISVRALLRESEHFEKGDDHIYTKEGNLPRSNRDSRLLSTRCEQEKLYLRSRRNEEFPGKARKRKADVSPDSDFVSNKRQKCFSKNAIMARINRERKKRYLANLENETQDLKNENKALVHKLKTQERTVKHLKMEVLYLKSLLSNSREICSIIQNIRRDNDIPITSTSISKPAKAATDCNCNNRQVKHSPEQGYISDTENVENADSTKEDQLVYCARTRSVQGGYNFPVCSNDVNLNSGSLAEVNLNLEDDDLPVLSDIETSNFEFDDNIFNQYSESLNIDLKSSVYDNFWDSSEPNLTHKDNEEPGNEVIPNVGVCLHINKEKISLEFCALCSNRVNKLMSLAERWKIYMQNLPFY